MCAMKVNKTNQAAAGNKEHTSMKGWRVLISGLSVHSFTFINKTDFMSPFFSQQEAVASTKSTKYYT
jgi:hypothetical protein